VIFLSEFYLLFIRIKKIIRRKFYWQLLGVFGPLRVNVLSVLCNKNYSLQ